MTFERIEWANVKFTYTCTIDEQMIKDLNRDIISRGNPDFVLLTEEDINDLYNCYDESRAEEKIKFNRTSDYQYSLGEFVNDYLRDIAWSDGADDEDVYDTYDSEEGVY